jgi:hypothetical protein
MNFRRAVKEALLFFPSELTVSIGSNGKGSSNNLAKAWEFAEDSSSNASVWAQLAVWSVGCALFRLAEEAGSQGYRFAYKKNIDFKYVEFKFAESLLTPNTWFPGEIKRAYQRDRCKRNLPPFIPGSNYGPTHPSNGTC